jgi:hypothetical protein
MDKFDRTNCRLLAEEIERALQPVAEKHGIVIRSGRGSFSPTNYTLKVECSVRLNGETVTREAEAFKRYAEHYGLKPEDLGKIISHGGRQFRIVGLKPNSRRFPVLAERLPDGKRFGLPAYAVRPDQTPTVRDWVPRSGDDTGEGKDQ